jgi:Flp pilus assembly protein TadG
VRPARRSQSGQALVVVAGILIALTLLGVLVFDVGLAMSDRRNLQEYADAAALAGARSYTRTSTAPAHWTAMQYLTSPLGFTLPTGGCSSTSVCPAGTYTISPYTVQLADSTLTGWNYPSVLDVVISHQQPGIFAHIWGYASVTTAASGRSALPGPFRIGALYAVAAVSGDVVVYGGGNGTQAVSGSAYAFGNLGGNNGPHSMGVAKLQTNYDGTTCPGNIPTNADFGGGSSLGDAWHWEPAGSGSGNTNLSVTAPTTYDNQGPTTAGPTYPNAVAAKDSGGHWKPGIYNGFTPNGGTMNPGVYKIIGVTNPAFGTITNTTYTGAGALDASGAVAIVLDSSDSGSLDISGMTLNGIDDMQSQLATGTRDPQGTHNFVLYGGNGAGAFAGTMNGGPGWSPVLSGIVYMPKVAYSQHGNPNFQVDGSATFASFQSNGTGTVLFNWVCGLNSIAKVGNGGGLIR